MNAIQLTIGEFEISIYANKSEHAGLRHFGEATIDVEYECKPGQRAILNRAPEDCQPGEPDSVAIWSIKIAAPMTFEAEGITTTFDAGYDIFHLLSKHRVEQLEDEILKSMTEDAYA